ncbi:UNVERIFIED_CONTAM: hypothetical protein Sradi_3851200 [Sesamum radiatum]|uniref:Uncharacterized protein n=1 Tax=Sesamum radiatum TaxID=300843 RepID=A0AAW2Q1U5_SESRA
MKAWTRLDFARVCAMLDFDSTLPKYLVVLVPRDDGSETPCRVDVEYEWVSAKCLACRSLGHPTTGCPSTKCPVKPLVTVFVYKLAAPSAPPSKEQYKPVEID